MGRDYLRVIEDLIRGYDLSRGAERKKAYRRCEEYAEKHLKTRLEFNALVGAVAEKLGLAPTRRNDFGDSLGQVPQSAKLFLGYDPKSGPEPTREGERRLPQARINR